MAELEKENEFRRRLQKQKPSGICFHPIESGKSHRIKVFDDNMEVDRQMSVAMDHFKGRETNSRYYRMAVIKELINFYDEVNQFNRQHLAVKTKTETAVHTYVTCLGENTVTQSTIVRQRKTYLVLKMYATKLEAALDLYEPFTKYLMQVAIILDLRRPMSVLDRYHTLWMYTEKEMGESEERSTELHNMIRHHNEIKERHFSKTLVMANNLAQLRQDLKRAEHKVYIAEQELAAEVSNASLATRQLFHIRSEIDLIYSHLTTGRGKSGSLKDPVRQLADIYDRMKLLQTAVDSVMGTPDGLPNEDGDDSDQFSDIPSLEGLNIKKQKRKSRMSQGQPAVLKNKNNANSNDNRTGPNVRRNRPAAGRNSRRVLPPI